MRHLVLTLALLLPGCVTVDRGLQAAQKGLAVVDVAVDAKAKAYAESVRLIRQHCAGDNTCEARYGVTDEDVARATARLAEISGHYDEVATALRAMAEEWPALSAEIEAALERAKALQP